MENPEFPPNSQASKKAPEDRQIPENRKVERVTSGDAVRKKKSLRRRFRESVIASDVKSVGPYILLDVLLPAVQDTIIEMVQTGIERLVRGESRRYRGISPAHPSPYDHSPYGRVNYTNYSTPSRLPSSQRALSRQARARHDFDEILLTSRTEAEEVIDQLFDVVSRYDTATVADLYTLVGLAGNHTDYKWGWTDLRGAGVSRTRDGYLLDLPDPIPLG